MQSTEEPTVAQVVKQVVQYSIGRRFDPSHRQRKTERERERERNGGGAREREIGGVKEMAPPTFSDHHTLTLHQP